MCMTLGGRAAEQIFYGRVSTGAADDLNKVTKLAYGQIGTYGMNTSIGCLSFPPDQNQEGMQTFRPYSEKLAEKMDEEAMAMVATAYQRTLDLLTKNKDMVAALAKELLEKETIGHDDIVRVLGERPFKNDTYKQYLENTRQFLEKHPDAAHPTGSLQEHAANVVDATAEDVTNKEAAKEKEINSS